MVLPEKRGRIRSALFSQLEKKGSYSSQRGKGKETEPLPFSGEKSRVGYRKRDLSPSADALRKKGSSILEQESRSTYPRRRKILPKEGRKRNPRLTTTLSTWPKKGREAYVEKKVSSSYSLAREKKKKGGERFFLPLSEEEGRGHVPYLLREKRKGRAVLTLVKGGIYNSLPLFRAEIKRKEGELIFLT